MRLPRWTWLAVFLAFAAGITLGLSLQLGFELRGESSAFGAVRGLQHFRLSPAGGLQAAGRLSALPVYVVEEHHEVLPYWRAVADVAGTRTVGHALVHFDAHPDMAVASPAKGDDFGLTSNDEFIFAAASQGLVDRFIWIWPAWDARGKRHKKHGDVRIVWSTLGHTDDELACICETKYAVEEAEFFSDPLGWQFFRSHSAGGQSSTPQCENSNEKKLDREAECIKERTLMQVFVNEQTLKKIEAWWPTLLAPPLILDIDEDHFGQKASASLLHEMKERLKDPLRDLSCLLNVSEAHVNYWMRRYVLAWLAHPGKDAPDPPEELLKLCPSRSLAQVGEGLADLRPLELQLLLLYGFCFTTSPRSVSSTENDRRYLRVCDAGAEVVAQDTDRSDAEEALAVEPVAMAHRLDLFATSLHTLRPFVEPAELVTICRSVRDGYTPNHVWFQIESNLLSLLGPNVTFDENLVGGPHGWEAWTQDAQTMLQQIRRKDLQQSLS